MKAIYIALLIITTMIATGCDKAFQFASTVPEAIRPVCTESSDDLSVPVLVQQGQSFSMAYKYQGVEWTLTNGSSVLRFSGSPVETSLNTLGTYVGAVTGMNGCADTVVQEFAIQVIAPVAGLSIVVNNNDQYTRVSSASLSLSATGASQMYVSNTSNCTSGGAWEAYSQSKAWTLGEANKLTRVYVKFKNSLIETPCISDDITHDDVAPVTRYVSVPTGTVNVTSVVVDMEADDATSGVKTMYCRIDAAAFRACVNRETFSSLAQGSHIVSMYAEDKAGNISQIDSRSFSVDTTLPTIRITSAPTDPSNSKNANFTFEGEDNGQPISRFDCSIDNAAFASCTTPKTYTNLAQGPHIFKVRGKDVAGNLSGEASHSWTIDSIAPIVTITSAPTTPTPDTNANFTFTATDSGLGIASVQCALDTAALADCTSPRVIFGLSNASHTFRVVARDFAGNIGSASHTWEVNDRIQTQPIVIQPVSNASDILFFMDTTGSMFSEYSNNIPMQFTNFLSILGSSDYRIGIVTSDYRDGGSEFREGKIVPVENAYPKQFVITPQTTDLHDNFIDTLARREVTCAYGTWTGPMNSFCGLSGWNLPVSTQIVKAALRTFDHPQNQFFFRDEIPLNIIVVSDSDEVCSAGMSGPDGACLPQDSEHSAESLLAKIKSKFPNKPLKVHALVHKNGDRGCDMGPSNVGHTYLKLAQMTGGIARSVCKGFSSEGNALANEIKAATQQPIYTLRCIPKDTNNDGKPDVEVTYNPQPSQPIVYEVVGSTIRFTPSPAAGTDVTLKYTCP